MKFHRFSLFAGIALATLARAETEPAPFVFSAARETALLATGLAGHLIGDYRLKHIAPARAGEFDRGDLSPLDRWNAGTWNPRADAASDLLVVAVGGAMLGADAWHLARGNSTRNPLLEDALILAQAYAWNSAINLNVRATRVHPRPFVYGDAAPESARTAPQAAGAFYSGHASAAFLGAVYLASVYPLRHPDFDRTGLLWTGSLAAAAGTAALRVAAGKHFPSDAIAGAAMGSLIGLGFVQLHREDATLWGWRAAPVVTPEGQAGIAAVRRL